MEIIPLDLSESDKQSSDGSATTLLGYNHVYMHANMMTVTMCRDPEDMYVHVSVVEVLTLMMRQDLEKMPMDNARSSLHLPQI